MKLNLRLVLRAPQNGGQMPKDNQIQFQREYIETGTTRKMSVYKPLSQYTHNLTEYGRDAEIFLSHLSGKKMAADSS